MTPTLEQQLLSTYSDILGYIDDDGVYQPRVFSIDCGDGWLSLVKFLLESAVQLNKSSPEQKIEISQIKEKFGELRIYYSGGDERIADLVDQVENISARTCEACGRPGQSQEHKGWILTRCARHTTEF